MKQKNTHEYPCLLFPNTINQLFHHQRVSVTEHVIYLFLAFIIFRSLSTVLSYKNANERTTRTLRFTNSRRKTHAHEARRDESFWGARFLSSLNELRAFLGVFVFALSSLGLICSFSLVHAVVSVFSIG